MRKTAVARLAEFLNDIPLLFPPLKHIAVEIASFCGFVYFAGAALEAPVMQDFVALFNRQRALGKRKFRPCPATSQNASSGSATA